MRISRAMVAVAVLALLAVACGGDDGDDGDAQPDAGGTTETATELPECPVDALAAGGEGGPVEVTVWHTFIAESRDTLIALTDEYNASQDRVRVRLESQGEDYEQLLRTYTEAIPSGDLPEIVLVDDPATQFMADSGTVLPAQACFEADGTDLGQFVDVAVEYYTVDGALQPGMLGLGTALLYYNRDHFEEAGLDPDDPPGTFEEMRTAAQAIKDAGVVEEPIVISMQPWLVEFWLTGAGHPIVDNENGRDGLATEGAFDNEGALELYTTLRQLQEDGLLKVVPDTEGNVDHFFAIGLEQASMLPDTSSAATAVHAFLEGELDPGDVGSGGADAEVDPGGLDIDAGPFPGLEAPGRGQVGGTAWYLTADHAPEMIAAAWDYLSFMNTPESQARWYLDGSFSPWLKAAVEQPEVRAAWEADRLGQWLETAYALVGNIDPEWPGPLIGPYTEVRDAIRDSLDRLTLEGRSPADAVGWADDQITDAVSTYAEDEF